MAVSTALKIIFHTLRNGSSSVKAVAVDEVEEGGGGEEEVGDVVEKAVDERKPFLYNGNICGKDF